jgi:DNA-binding transcriptional LysR family regulator
MGWRTLLGDSRAVVRQLILQTDDLEAQTEACSAGLGLIFVPSWVVEEELKSGKLTQLEIAGLNGARQADIHLLRNAGRPTAAIEALSQFLRQRIGKRLASY